MVQQVKPRSPRQSIPVSSLYLHFPFCRSKCPYCSFSSVVGTDDLIARYLTALAREIENSRQDEKRSAVVDTLYLGGGTPSLCSASQLATIIHRCSDVFQLSDDIEMTIEVNPGTIKKTDFKSLRQIGFNRVSIGMQALKDSDLSTLGRCHSTVESLKAYDWARQADFTNVSVDLMYGLPNQGINDWRQTIMGALDLNPEHLSIYQLTVEPDTPFFQKRISKALQLPDEDTIEEMDRITLEHCEASGVLQYEISNFASPGFKCRHNLNYWHNDPYYGFGAGAVSYLSGVRVKRQPDPDKYCECIEGGLSVESEKEQLDQQAAYRETVVIGLRMNEGVSDDRLVSRFGVTLRSVYGALLQRLIDQELLEWCGEYLRLTPKGRRFANIVLSELV